MGAKCPTSATSKCLKEDSPILEVLEDFPASEVKQTTAHGRAALEASQASEVEVSRALEACVQKVTTVPVKVDLVVDFPTLVVEVSPTLEKVECLTLEDSEAFWWLRQS